MIVLLDTSTPTCYLTLVDGDEATDYEWLAERTLAHGLLQFLVEKVALHGKTLHDISAIGVMKGPGSFTGLRIGLTVMNTLAHDRNIPIVGVSGEGWQQAALARLSGGNNDQLVMPEYGANAHVTKQRK